MSDQVFIALISAGGVLLGVGLSQIITLMNGHLTRKHERQVVLRQKYEKMVDDLNKAMSEIVLFHTRNVSEKLEIIGLVRNVYTLSLIYFHDLRYPSADFLEALIDYCDVLDEEHTEKDLKEAKAEFKRTRLILEEAIAIYANRYT